ncbi:MAG: hypothetical protein EP335_17555 [Alphaproteobacteria bacterium]|nr:MAG: hypothetical protein EP335_17555 [Alphaproteobacteria bacterium]
MKAKQSDRALVATARGLLADVQADPGAPLRERLVHTLETRLVSATWTLRRLPDREAGFRRMRGCLWPETRSEGGDYAGESLTSLQARRRVRISAHEVDQMQPTLDLLLLLPDMLDRRILFFAAWHQDGEAQSRIPWAKVRRSLGLGLSRWTLKRRYDAGLQWLAALVALQA